MLNPYSYPLNYGNQQPSMYSNTVVTPDIPQPIQTVQYNTNNVSSVPAGVGGALLGTTIGCISGIRKNPYIEGNSVNGEFAVRAYERNLKNLEEPLQKSYKECIEVLKKIDAVKNAEELKELLDKNQEAAKEVCTALGKTSDEFLASVTDKNLSKNKKVIAEKLNSANATRFQDMKNQILNAWDSKANKFVKPENMDDKLYKSIKNSTYGMKAKTIAKHTVIGGAIAGLLAYGAHKLYTHKKGSSQQQY